MQKTSSAARDGAHRRLKRATAITLAGSGALVAAFAGLAAKALPGRSTATTTKTPNTRAAASSTRATPPPLIPAESAVTPAAPSSTPQQTQSPPVAVSGGS